MLCKGEVKSINGLSGNILMICKTKLDTIFMFCKSLHWNKFRANVFGKLWCFKTYWSL